MQYYLFLKVLHIISVIGLVGPLLLAPKWLHLSQHDIAQSMMHDLHRVTGVAGWFVLLFGSAMLYLQNGEMLYFPWMIISITIFIAIQLFDHFWADAREKESEINPNAPKSALKKWLIGKIGLYFLITSLMILKPTF